MNRAKLLDPLHGFVNSFKQFEKKLAKLQDDVSFHGNTLNELRNMVANLAISVSNDGHKKSEDKTPQHKRTVGVQYEVYFLQHRRRCGDLLDSRNIHLKPKVALHQKLCKAPEVMPKQKTNSMTKHKRPTKINSPRRANTLRVQKNVDKKRKRK